MKITSKITFFISNAIKDTIDFIFPQVCPSCEKTIDRRELFCQECFDKITFIKGTMCHRCGRPLFCPPQNGKLLCLSCLKKRPTFDMARAVFLYDEFSKRLKDRLDE